MSTLDQSMENYQQPYMGTALRYGLIGGLVLIIVSLMGYILGMNDSGNQAGSIGLSLLRTAAVVVFMVLAVRAQRNELQSGYITFGRAFVVALLVGVVGGLLRSVFEVLYVSVIDPDFMQRAMDAVYQQYEEMGMSEEQIEQSISMVKMFMNPGGLLIGNLIYVLIGSTILGLIIGGVMQKKPLDQ